MLAHSAATQGHCFFSFCEHLEYEVIALILTHRKTVDLVMVCKHPSHLAVTRDLTALVVVLRVQTLFTIRI